MAVKKTKTTPMTREERALNAVLKGLRIIRNAAGESPETRCAEELALNAILSLAESAGLGPANVSAERMKQARNVLFGGSPSDPSGIRIRDIADALLLASAGKGKATREILVSADALRLAAAHGGVEELITMATVRLSPTLAWHATSTTLVTTHLRLASIDARLADADIPPLVERLVKGEALSGVITDLLLATGALATAPTRSRQSVQDRVSKALKNR